MQINDYLKIVLVKNYRDCYKQRKSLSSHQILQMKILSENMSNSQKILKKIESVPNLGQ